MEGGYLYPNDKPGLGIDIDEAKAARLLNADKARIMPHIEEDRRSDGTVVRP
jgi:mannonate dehydratase